MKREIKFRAKELKNFKWRYGNLHIVERCSQCHIVDFGNIYPIEEKDTTIQYGGVLNWWEVEPETVGQFTGLKDKNGVEIYEGDIVEHTISDNMSVHEVYFDNEMLEFGLRDSNELFHCQFSDEFELVGNIHDNQELLK